VEQRKTTLSAVQYRSR